MSNIPANLYFGPELPLDAIPGAIFNDGVCLYRGGEYGWMYMCHVSTVQKTENSPLADYAVAIPEGTLATLNEPMAYYRSNTWLSLSNKVEGPKVLGILHEKYVHSELGVKLELIPDDSVYVYIQPAGEREWAADFNALKLFYRHNGEDYLLDSELYVPVNMVSECVNRWLAEEKPYMPYLDLDISARFAVNTDKPPSPGDNWIDSEFNEFVFDADRMWIPIGKIAFNYRGSMLSGIDVLRLRGPHKTGDAYLVDNFMYIYNDIVNRFVVIQCAPGSDDVPFNFYPPEALEPIPMQGIYRRDFDTLPCEPNGCGWIIVELDGKHSLYNQYGLLVEVDLPKCSIFPEGKRAPMVVMGPLHYRDACYQWDGFDPEDGDVWLNEKQLYTYHEGTWRVLPAGVPYTRRHNSLAMKVEELKERIKLGHDMNNPLLSQQAKDQLFEEQHRQYEVEAALKQERLTEQERQKQFERAHPFRTWIRRLRSSKPR